MESCVRNHPVLAVVAMAAAASLTSTSSSSSSCQVDAFTMPPQLLLKQPSSTTRTSTPPSSSTTRTTKLYQIGLGPKEPTTQDEIDAAQKQFKKDPIFVDQYNPNRIINDENGVPKPHITDFEPYRTSRMSNSDKDADAWFGKLLNAPGGESFLGEISKLHKERLLTKVELKDGLSFLSSLFSSTLPSFYPTWQELSFFFIYYMST